MQHFKPTVAIPLGEVTAFVPEDRLYQRTRHRTREGVRVGQRISPAVLADLAVIAVANDQGFEEIAATVLRGMEARLGVTEHDRVAALAGKAMTEYAFVPLNDAPERLDRLRSALSERASREKPLAVTKLLRAVRENRDKDLRTASLLRVVDMKEAALSRALTEKAKRKAGEALDDALIALREHVEAMWREDAAKEGEELAALRGDTLEEVETSVSDWIIDPLTGVPIRDRKTRMPVLRTEWATAKRAETSNGLAKTFEAGALDGGKRNIRAEQLLRAGKRYQEAYEIAEGKASPARELGMPATKRCTPSSGPQNQSLEAAETLALMRGTDVGVVERFGISLLPFQRAVLDAVCGEDLAVSTAADRLHRSHADAKRALRDGLEIVCVNMGWC